MRRRSLCRCGSRIPKGLQVDAVACGCHVPSPRPDRLRVDPPAELPPAELPQRPPAGQWEGRPRWFLERFDVCSSCEDFRGGGDQRAQRCGILEDLGKGAFVWGGRGIPRPGARCPLGLWGPVDLRAQLVELEEPLWTDPPDPDFLELPAESSRLVCTVATGRAAGELLELTEPAMRRYAQRVGADFLAITHATHRRWQMDKLRVGRLAARYERTFFVDADAILTEALPDVFAEVPAGSIGLHDDYPFLQVREWLSGERRLVGRAIGETLEDPSVCLNTGLVVLDREHASLWSPPAAVLPPSHCSEQVLLEHRFLRSGSPIWRMPTAWNVQWWMADYSERLEGAAVVHLANCPEKITHAKAQLDRLGLYASHR